MTDEILGSMTPVPGLDPVTKLQIDSTIVSTGVPVNVKGGVDELMVIRSPINQLDLIQFYENSTFVHKEAYCSFDDMGNYLNTSSVITGVMNNAARLVSGIDSINMTSVLDTDMCFFDINKCVHGFTIRFAFRLVKDLDVDQVIMTTGGDNLDGLGFALTYTASNTSLPFRRYFQVDVRQSINEYTTWFNIHDIWTDLFITWHPSFGIRVFVDGILAICDFSIQQARLSSPTIFVQNLIIGQETGGLWRHAVHETPEADLIQQYTEVTRDECYQYCTDQQCDSYTVCDNEYYSTCNLYSNTTNTTHIDQSCDLFTRYLLDFFPVQDAGCLSNTSVSIAIDLSPSMDCSWTILLINETLSLEFEVNDQTYAGYKVDAGDGRNVNYTSYNSTEIRFHTQGFYFVEVTAMNEISSITVYVNVTVFIPVEGVLINNTKIVATNSAEQIIINIQQGTLITCDIDFGDGTNDTMFQPNSSIPFVFTHVYTFEQHADINVTCFNELSQEYNASLLIAIDPIVNLSMMAPDSVIFGQNVSVDLFFIHGSNISMDIKWNDIMALNPFYADPNGTISINVVQEIYNRTENII
ncbi:unnamed protein product [Mytilus edulis]|uniref:PKD domain-containing protein n=1 Tax=Mytilus edulis TaxID=6550 RepID=A0A8S3TQX1_MYTED|nr:unnamed protein product [Mytilus edulis]